MTNPGEDAGQTASSESSAGTSEPSSSGYEAPPIEQAPEQSQEQAASPQEPSQEPEQPTYTPPPAYDTPSAPQAGFETPGYSQASGYPPPSYPPPEYTPPPSYPPPGTYGYAPPPYPDPSNYGPQGYPPPQFGTPPQYGAPPPGYGAPPPGYGQPPTGYPAANYAGAYGQPAQKTNTLAIVSLVASVIGFIPFCIFGLGSIIGIVLGVVALNQVKTSGEGGRGLAIAGIAVGAVSLLSTIFWSIVFLNV